MSTTTRLVTVRRGLPRVVGGEPWPPPGQVEREVRPPFLADLVGRPAAPASVPSAPVAAPVAAVLLPAPVVPPAEVSNVAAAPTTRRQVALRRGLPRTTGGDPWPPAGWGVRTVAETPEVLAPAAPTPAVQPSVPQQASSQNAVETISRRVPLRRGLPRTAGGDAWPPAGQGIRVVAVAAEPVTTASAPVEVSTPVEPPAVLAAVPAAPKPVPPPVAPAALPATRRNPAQLVAAVGTLVKRFPVPAVAVAVAGVGAVLSLTTWLGDTAPVEAFVARYPGTYALPASAEPGFPAWVRWSHFLNAFFILLIIRTGLQVRHEQKPPAQWTPRSTRFGGKISITLWLHQTLDLLWLLNGLVFLVLLFATTHWVRLVPTSWAVLPNALSALVQYVSLDWPAETGWTAYNSLQQLAYFTVVFVAAPLAAVTGFRMSGMWPQKARRLSARYPVELARAVHLPTMIFFVAFVVVHVALVFATGARENLNHMYAGSDLVSWTGFWVFAAGLAVFAVAWQLARPTLLAPLASLMGRVSQR